MTGFLEVKLGFDGDTCEVVARALGGAVAVSFYGPSGEMRDYSAWIPCPDMTVDCQARAFGAACDVAGRRLRMGRWSKALPYGTRSVWDATAKRSPRKA